MIEDIYALKKRIILVVFDITNTFAAFNDLPHGIAANLRCFCRIVNSVLTLMSLSIYFFKHPKVFLN